MAEPVSVLTCLPTAVLNSLTLIVCRASDEDREMDRAT
jgi:hypothetical protein